MLASGSGRIESSMNLTEALADGALVDVRVAEQASVIVEAGAHDVSLKIPANHLIAAAHADVADVADG